MNEIVEIEVLEIMANLAEKWEMNYRVVFMWFWAECHGYSLPKYIKECGYKKLAIYGMGEIGELLYYELEKENVNIDFVIDQKKCVYCDCPIYTLDEDIPETDQVIITIEYEIQEIADALKRKKIQCISLQQVLCDMTGLVL